MEEMNNEETFYDLYCEEEDPQSSACSACKDDSQQTEEAPRIHLQTTTYNIRSKLMSQHLDTPAGEVESYMEISCKEEETEPAASDTKIPTHGPEEQNNLQVPEEVQDEASAETSHIETDLESLLEDLGLKQYYREKLSLSKILEIDEKTISDEPVKCKSNNAWYFLKKLMMVNATARNAKCASLCDSICDDASESMELDLDDLFDSKKSENMLNPLDIITALFLCSDGFVQQEMALKMSMCQFSVPLLLPKCDTTECTLTLWAMRDIVKKYRPQHLLESKGFVEERIVHSKLPMVSFVRLGDCSMSKSEILNKLLSSSQQYHDTFVHHDMESGDTPRKISNGLTEMTWYLPCGNKNMDVFVEPVAIANLHGDIASFETQFSFLCQTSAAVFVFFDHFDSGSELLLNQNHKAQIFLVGNAESKSKNSVDALKTVASRLCLTKNNIIIKTKEKNEAHFVQHLRKTVSNVVENSNMKMSIVQMADIAHELGILVDEDSPECQAGKQKADAITEHIEDILKYKENQLPLQGEIWKELTFLEKEEFRLKKVGSEKIEQYKSDLQKQKKQLREKQNSYDMSPAMSCFIDAISSSRTERCYFLKWMRMNLDNVSCIKLSGLREKYKEKCKGFENKDEIKEIDRQLSNSSLGTEHFFREMGQIYEASVSLSETDPSRKQLQHLPKLGAQLLLDGFPLELVDGDASNIPLRWVSDVLSELNDLVSQKNKMMVVTVLGVQSTGKSTLLNTMFGVQFAVSSGRCTRGAFMLLIKVNEDVRKDLNCDFMVIIDTEGLKSPELAQLDNSHEHDNELATLVVGLSDITIINIAMENSVEMKDILQIVVHAFLRMEVGKKPKCQFVHQNVSDVSAHEKNLRDRKMLLQQLNEMTQAAAKMEKKEKNKSFTDVMEYNPDTGNCYVPGLWNGNPPMAPVNAGYSEAVYELKKNIIHLLGEGKTSANNILEFSEWMKSLWNAVKHENFIFSFRNSLVADAYMRLCTEFNKWEWEFKKEMYTWVTKAETRISNFGTVAAKSEICDMTELLTQLTSEAASELSKWETKLLDNLKEYFKQTEGHVYLVERYREDFANSAKSLRREMESSVTNQLTAAADIRRGMKELDEIKKNHTKEIEKAVCELIDECRKKKVEMIETELDQEFDKMWEKTLNKLSFSQQKPKDVFNSVSHRLRTNLSHKGSHACELLDKEKLEDCGLKPFNYTGGFLKKFQNTCTKFLWGEDQVKAAQQMADSIISACKDFVAKKMERKSNYHDTYIQEILHIIDERLNNATVNIEFEVSLKMHICGFSARDFQKMHEDFIKKNDPYICLMGNMEKFRTDFKNVFSKRDQCQKKAEEFAEQCLKPAVEVFVNRHLGPDIIDEMLKKEQFSTRKSFQYSLLLDLLSKNDFNEYLDYVRSYEDYVKSWIFDRIVEHFSSGDTILQYEDRHLKSSINSIKAAIKNTEIKNVGTSKTFVEEICKELGEELVISPDALNRFLFLNNVDVEPFAHSLTVCLDEIKDALKKEFKEKDIRTKLENLHLKPQNELFSRMIGCGKLCPFCAVPCEAGAKDHSEHFASLHRSQAFGTCRWDKTGKLATEICTSLIVSEFRFNTGYTGGFHPFKTYREIFPDWNILPDVSFQASDYWKYVITKYNDQFAKEFAAKPADIPEPWREITESQAIASLQESFRTK